MKKLIAIILLVFLFVSCGVNFVDDNGFSLYSVSNMTTGDYLVRSTDGFIIDEMVYIEQIAQSPFTMENRLNRDIVVDVFYDGEGFFITIPANGELIL